MCHDPLPTSDPHERTEDECDISGLLDVLETVTDRRDPRGLIHGQAFLLAAALVAMLAGATNFRQIAGQAADLPQSMLRKLGAQWCYFTQRFLWSSLSTFRRVLENIDADELDRVVGLWLLKNAHPNDDHQTLTLAIDGKVLKGAWTDENEKFTLFSAMVHRMGVTVAQVAVPADTNEITQVQALLDTLPDSPDQPVIVTMDAAHTQRDTAVKIKEKPGYEYIMTVKGNQPSLQESLVEAILPLLKDEPGHHVEERAHGRISSWKTWITKIDGIDFPHIEQAACIRRDVHALDGTWISKEIAITATSCSSLTAADMHKHVREHWGIENKSHYVRDVTWHEDTQQIRTGSGPQVTATLRNVAASLLRLCGYTKIKETTEHIARDRTRALPILATRRHR